MQGDFVWFEMATDDPDAIGGFYSRVLGWTLEDARIPGMQYRNVKAGDAQIAGLMAYLDDLPAAARKPEWIGYIAVDDVDATTGQLADGRGHVHRPPEDLAGVGRLSVVADPQGATFMLFRPAGPLPSSATGPGAVAWRELHCHDVAEALGFYSGLVGWTGTEPGAVNEDRRREITVATAEGRDFGSFVRGSGQAKGEWVFYFSVADIDVAERTVLAAGGSVVGAPYRLSTGLRALKARDPAGGLFALVELGAGPAR